MRSLSQLRKRAISALISLIAFLIALEVSARIDDKIKYDAPFFHEYSPRLLRSKDSDGLNHNIPRSHFEKWKINNFGFRGADISLSKSDSLYRIICMGTSETFGLYESPGSEWPAQLQNMLADHNRFEVINASVVGLSLSKYRSYMEKYVLKVKPDVVILLINYFDYAIGAETFAKRQNVIEQKADVHKEGKVPFFNNVLTQLRMVPKIKITVKRILPEYALKRYQLWGINRQLQAIETRRLNGLKPIDIIPRNSISTFRSDLEELIHFLHDKKIEIILTTYPVLISKENIDEYLEIFLDHRRFYVELSLLGIIDASEKFNETIKSTAHMYGIALLDNAASFPKNTQYFADNVHYTDKGARLIASNFAFYLKEQSFYHDKSH
jgi:lysophospholipase L1-like esterase